MTDLSRVHALVIGDVMLDRTVWGDVTRISPEAPVPIVSKTRESATAGGAANTALNIASLGAQATLIGVIGDDAAGEQLTAIIKQRGVVPLLIVDKSRPTIQKTRIMGGRQQLARLDKESREPLSGALQAQLVSLVKGAAKHAQAIVISDYAKGTLSEGLMAAIKESAPSKHIICDGKPQNKALFAGCTLITPNRKEAYEMAGAHEGETPATVATTLSNELGCSVVITLAEEGMLILEKDGAARHIKTQAREVYDVSGAGDTVVATIGVCLGAGMELAEACTLANKAAGIVVGKIGTATVSTAEIFG